jgi:hypothetical protein
MVYSEQEMEDRLKYIRNKVKKFKIYYSRYNPRSEMMYDVEDADEDFFWMMHEIERLRIENDRFKEFTEFMRDEIKREIED